MTAHLHGPEAVRCDNCGRHAPLFDAVLGLLCEGCAYGTDHPRPRAALALVPRPVDLRRTR